MVHVVQYHLVFDSGMYTTRLGGIYASVVEAKKVAGEGLERLAARRCTVPTFVVWDGNVAEVATVDAFNRVTGYTGYSCSVVTRTVKV